MKHLDLFSGIGGFALAAKWAAIKTIGFCEKDKFCQKVLSKHWPDVPICDDIHDFNYDGNVDILTASMPCQPFSQAGNKNGKSDRRYLWPELLRVIRRIYPTWIISENVTGMVQISLDDVIRDLEAENYSVSVYLIPACSISAPHRRERLWIVAYFNGIGINLRERYREKGYLQTDKKWDLAKIQQEWSQFIPDTWKTFKVRDWLQYNSDASRRDDGISERLDKDRIKALGNAIVPQMAYIFFRLIKEISSLTKY